MAYFTLSCKIKIKTSRSEQKWLYETPEMHFCHDFTGRKKENAPVNRFDQQRHDDGTQLNRSSMTWKQAAASHLIKAKAGEVQIN